MKRLLLLIALACSASSLAACASNTDDTAIGEDDLTSVTSGTYVVDSSPWGGGLYAKRITFGNDKSYEAEIVKSFGDTQIVAGTWMILPARPNNPQSPIKTDKPTLVLQDDTGNGSIDFEFDRLPSGGLKLYGSARHYDFTMKRDPSYRPEPTNGKTIACTGPGVDAKITLDKAQNRRGTLTIERKPSADRHDPPDVTVNITQTEGGGVPDYVYFEGSSGEQDYYVNMKKKDFERGSGSVELHLKWAEGGQEFDTGATCKYE